MNEISFKEVLNKLDIEDYAERIWNSNSRGELLHIQQYFTLAKIFEKKPHNFRKWFESCVEFAENNWERPESVFQHIATIFVKKLEKDNILDPKTQQLC